MISEDFAGWAAFSGCIAFIACLNLSAWLARRTMTRAERTADNKAMAEISAVW